MATLGFDVEALKEMEGRIDELHRFALKHQASNPALCHIIDQLTRVAGMFANYKVQELEGRIETYDPQGYIQDKLAVAYRWMELYKGG